MKDVEMGYLFLPDPVIAMYTFVSMLLSCH
jgi:hypothetical protein